MVNNLRVELFRHNDDIERPEGVRTSWQSITPDYATRALDVYEKFCDEHPDERMNRPVNQAQVDKYAADMKAGRWGRNHQGLAFDKNGVLMDGQHRLWAVVESETTVMMPVTHGLDREAQLTIDSGLRRSTADVAAIAGFSGVRELHIGMARAMLRGTAATRPVNTRMQELELLKEHWKAIEFVVSQFPKQKVPGITRAPVLAAVARAYYTQDQAKLSRFCAVLVSGIVEDSSEHLIITLRNWLVGGQRGRGPGSGGASTMEAYGKTTRALQAYLRGEKIRILYAATTDPFPLPARRRS